MKAKKHLSFTALRTFVSKTVRSWPDPRRTGSTSYSVHDAVMSGLACMYFQEPSLLQFQTELEVKDHGNNVRNMFGVEAIPKTNALKEILDSQDSCRFADLFKGVVQRLQRGKQLKQFQLIQGLTVCSMDGTQYYSSESVRCNCCTTKHKDNKEKATIYQHFALQAAFMHPDLKQVVPVMAESISNRDGNKKQDCELNAAKRLIPLLREQFPKMGMIITGDDLFSHQPMIECVLNKNFHFFFVAKPKSHSYMMEWLGAYDQLHEYRERDKRGRTILYQWINNIPLNGTENAIQVNYFSQKLLRTDKNGEESVYRTQSWVTDMEVNKDNVVLFTKGAKTRWKIENECFNTLKNQGYHLEHNYGHGEKNLAFNFYLLTLLAFSFHQILELCDIAFKASRAKTGSKRSLWEKLRTLIYVAIFETWEQLLDFLLDRDAYDIIGGYVVDRIQAHPPP